MTTSPGPATTRGLLERAAALRLLSLLFQPPTPDHAGKLRPLADLVPEKLRPQAQQLADRLAAAGSEAEAAYHRLLGSAGSCRDCASDQGDAPSLAAKAEVARVASLYELFGFPGAGELSAPPDSAAAELSFAGFLLLKQAYARERGDLEAEAQVRAGLRLFVEEHLGTWLPALLDALDAVSAEGPYAGLGSFARVSLEALGLLEGPHAC